MHPALKSVKPARKVAVDRTIAAEFEKCLDDDLHHAKIFTVEVPSRGVIIIDEVLSKEECGRFCTACQNCKELVFWNALGRDDDAARSFRDADTVEIKSDLLSDSIWSRMHDLLSDKSILVSDDVDDENWERELVGKWEASSLNNDLLFVKYPSGGAFAPHTDGRAIRDFNERSFFSVIIFLNDILPENGGGTQFYTNAATQHLKMSSPENNLSSGQRWTADQSLKLGNVPAVSGRMLIFHQSLVHEGVPPSFPNCKYIIRSDVMYKRYPKICAQPNDLTAYAIFREAEDLAENGFVSESISLFRQCFKLSPEMARVMGQG